MQPGSDRTKAKTPLQTYFISEPLLEGRELTSQTSSTSGLIEGESFLIISFSRSSEISPVGNKTEETVRTE